MAKVEYGGREMMPLPRGYEPSRAVGDGSDSDAGGGFRADEGISIHSAQGAPTERPMIDLPYSSAVHVEHESNNAPAVGTAPPNDVIILDTGLGIYKGHPIKFTPAELEGVVKACAKAVARQLDEEKARILGAVEGSANDAG